MRIVVAKGEIFEAEVVNVFYGRIQMHSWQRPEIPGELFARLVEVVLVKMQAAEGVDEFAGAQTCATIIVSMRRMRC